MEARKKQEILLVSFGFALGILFFILLMFIGYTRHKGSGADAFTPGGDTVYGWDYLSPSGPTFWDHLGYSVGIGYSIGGGTGSGTVDTRRVDVYEYDPQGPGGQGPPVPYDPTGTP